MRRFSFADLLILNGPLFNAYRSALIAEAELRTEASAKTSASKRQGNVGFLTFAVRNLEKSSKFLFSA